MKRDTIDLRIDEIRELATKYSKKDLQRMVQMGIVEPQKAVMAGMMIDRIAKSAIEPPTTTVAEDVLGTAAPTAAQAGMPAPGIMGAPQAPAPSDGVAALPSGLQNMAGGGIVAFADGGETDDIPGYADRGLVDAGVIDKIDPNWRSTRNRKKYTADDKFAILAEQLRDLQSELGSATGEDKRRLEGNIAQVQREMRGLRAAPSQAADIGGLGALISSAQAAEVAPMSRAPTAPSAPQRLKTARERLFEQQVLEDYGLGPQTLTPQQQKASEESAQRAMQLQEKQKQLRELEGGFFSQKPLTEQQSAEAQRIRSEMEGFKKLPPITPPSQKPAAPTTFEPTVETPVRGMEEVPMPESRMGPPRPSVPDQLLGGLRAAQMEVPKEKGLADVAKEQAEADKLYGVDTKAMFDQLRQDYKESGGKLKDRADKAAGMAWMMFAAGLAGARQGEEWERASRSGQQALMSYMGAMDRINENEDRLNQSLRELSMAENQYKRSRSDKALAEVNANKREIRAIQMENTKLEQQGLLKAAEFSVDLFKNQNPAQWTTIENIARESGMKPMDVYLASLGMAKTGQLTFNQALEAVQRNMKTAMLPIEEQMGLARKMVTEGGGGGGGGLPAPKSQDELAKLPKGTTYLAPDGSTRIKQ